MLIINWIRKYNFLTFITSTILSYRIVIKNCKKFSTNTSTNFHNLFPSKHSLSPSDFVPFKHLYGIFQFLRTFSLDSSLHPPPCIKTGPYSIYSYTLPPPPPLLPSLRHEDKFENSLSIARSSIDRLISTRSRLRKAAAAAAAAVIFWPIAFSRT